MATVASAVGGELEAVAVRNRRGRGGFVLVCEHASNHVPPAYRGLGLDGAGLARHIAWDIGAHSLAERLATLLDAPLVHATHSRLLIDLNRDPAAPDSIVETSEDTPIPGNRDLPPGERLRRRQWLYEPFHAMLDSVLDERLAADRPTALVSIHSFTPTYLGRARPWHAGLIFRHDRRLSDPLLAALQRERELCIGVNEPYGPGDGVYHTIGRHGEGRGLPCAMLEVRNDQIADAEGQARWAARLAADFRQALVGLHSERRWGSTDH